MTTETQKRMLVRARSAFQLLITIGNEANKGGLKTELRAEGFNDGHNGHSKLKRLEYRSNYALGEEGGMYSCSFNWFK